MLMLIGLSYENTPDQLAQRPSTAKTKGDRHGIWNVNIHVEADLQRHLFSARSFCLKAELADSAA
jgi:hypothetical protein